MSAAPPGKHESGASSPRWQSHIRLRLGASARACLLKRSRGRDSLWWRLSRHGDLQICHCTASSHLLRSASRRYDAVSCHYLVRDAGLCAKCSGITNSGGPCSHCQQIPSGEHSPKWYARSRSRTFVSASLEKNFHSKLFAAADRMPDFRFVNIIVSLHPVSALCGWQRLLSAPAQSSACR